MKRFRNIQYSYFEYFAFCFPANVNYNEGENTLIIRDLPFYNLYTFCKCKAVNYIIFIIMFDFKLY